MVVHIRSIAFNGIDVTDVDVQIQMVPGVPNFTIVGLADKTITESRERVKASLAAVGLGLPTSKILVNLAPADLIKEGSHFDLAIACGILGAMGVLPAEKLSEYLILGELSLDGSILPVSGVLPAAMGAVARDLGIICPFANGKEAAWSGNDAILAPTSIIALVNHFKSRQILIKPEPEIKLADPTYLDMSDIIGQDSAKRAIEIAAAGGHNIIMSGPPGTGKSMLAQRMVGILPEMNNREILECSMIYSVAGLLHDGKLTTARPFRAPHHSCSIAAMVGGGMGRKIKPGEVSFAHNGVLFLDELPEFAPNVVESLRQPIETGDVLIARSSAHIKFPCNFQLVAAMNPCKCGYVTDLSRSCSKAPKCASDYQMKISGPIMDRFDIHIEVADISPAQIQAMQRSKDTSKDIATRIRNARKIQAQRFAGYGITTNSKMDGHLLMDYATPQDDGLQLLNNAAVKFKISMRGYNRILRVARTIADLENNRYVNKGHISEAIHYRQMLYNRNI